MAQRPVERVPQRPIVGDPVPNPDEPGPAPAEQEVQYDPLNLGILNNRRFISHHIAESPLTATIKFPAINFWPIVEPWDHPMLLSLATIYAEARYNYGGIVNPALKRAIVAGETLSPKLPRVKISTQADARMSVIAWMRAAMHMDSFAPMGDYTNDLYQRYRADPDVLRHFRVNELPNAYPWTRDQIDRSTIESIIFIMYFYATFLRINPRHLAIENITLAYCALAKRGQVTDEFCTKIQTSVRDELGINITLNQPALNTLYKSYMMGVNETNAGDIFRDLDALIPDLALRLKLTLQQAAGSGMTLYIIIGRAMRMYNNFPWGRVNTLTGGELVNWNGARVIIHNNLYYGFRRDMGPARSTLYKSLGYVARELLVKINGERTLLRYAGLGGNIKNKNALDHLIAHYVETYVAVEGEERIEERAVVPLMDDLAQNDLFA